MNGLFAKLAITELRAQVVTCSTYACFKGGPADGEGLATAGCPAFGVVSLGSALVFTAAVGAHAVWTAPGTPPADRDERSGACAASVRVKRLACLEW